MRNKALLLVTLLITSGSVLAEKDLLGNAGKQLLKDTATSAAPKEAVEGVDATSQKLEESVESAPDALKGQAQDIATESAKKKLNEAVPEKAKQGVETIKSSTKTAKKVQSNIPKSSSEATKAVKAKAHEEATKKALDMLK